MSIAKRVLASLLDGDKFSEDELDVAGTAFCSEEVETWLSFMCTTSACASANWVCKTSTCCCREDMAPTHPYTGSLTLALASYTIELTASLRWYSGSSCNILLTLLAPKTLCTLANLCGSSAGK
ncbi:hypothetical protein V8G54_024029 [Vigna mungo]|uniref:Uncharacterized protein n=1 Tax=Vigna mungo TaxID=3915 RepID=A0AAQ3N6J7_VIGMU